MGIDLSEALRNWFAVYPRIEAPSQLALSVMASQNLWRHVEFLSLVQALEGLHRSLFKGTYLPDDQYDAIKKSLNAAIPSTLPSDHRDALRSRIRYGNQLSLRKRLAELADRIPDFLRASILGATGKVPSTWVDTRNYYTHWDEDLRKDVLSPEGMYYAGIRMRHFLRALYLTLLDIPAERIQAALAGISDESQELLQVDARERQSPQGGTLMSVQEISGASVPPSSDEHQANESATEAAVAPAGPDSLSPTQWIRRLLRWACSLLHR
jgi:hypothetical protein